jgi:hypothetical protein
MGKQAIAPYTSNLADRMDVVGHVLDYPAPPLVTTWVEDILRTDMLPAGQTVMVAIITYTGFNQEDSLIANQASIDRGMFRSTLFHTVRKVESTNGSEIERFERPDTDTCLVLKSGNYDTVGEDGMVQPGQRLTAGDCIVGQTMLMQEIQEHGKKPVRRDRSLFVRGRDQIVDKVLTSTTPDGHGYCKVGTREPRIPKIGDKFSCYTPDHQLLTARGWVGVADVAIGDLVATLDPETGRVSYEEAEAVHVYPVEDEPLYEVDAQHLSLRTTMNHNMYVRRRHAADFALVRAEDVHGKRVRFLKNCGDGLQASQCVAPACPVPVQDVDAFLLFFGLWMGDGWAENGSVTFCRAARAAAQTCGLDPAPDGRQFRVHHGPLADMLAPLAVPDKRLPEWCFHLSRAQSARVLDGLMDSGGSADAYHTSSSGLRDDVQRLALHGGWSADVDACAPAAWRVRVHRRDNSPELHGRETVAPWTGNVHCVTVRTGIVYVRRHGKTVWCGNSRHGQKGVIGQILRPEDMPFAEDGSIPDLIVNCHAFPSRMTIGHLVECLAGQLAAREGLRADGTPFRDTSRESLGDALAELGLCRHGTKRMQCGTTGKMMDCQIFYGPTFYQRLKHMADDKMHARSRGPIQIMVRQAVEGKARDGGLRYGEMERDTLISHGAPYMMLDRMLEQSDAYKVPICRPCGLIAQHPCLSKALVHRAREAVCRRCGGHDIIFQVMPYPAKLLFQELQVMSIDARFEFDDPPADRPAAEPLLRRPD